MTLAADLLNCAGIAQRAQRLSGSSLVELFHLARSRHAVDLAVGTPGFPEPPTVMIDAAVRALRGGHNQYADPRGEASLRQQIAASFSAATDPETELTITAGGTEALCVALLATVDPGDEVVIFEPYYENFLHAVALAGGIPRFVALAPPEWRWDSGALAAAVNPRTRAIILNTPSNPTGRLLVREELLEIAELCARWDVTVISDEVYADLVFPGAVHVSVADIPALRPRSIVIGSLSKSVAVSGWRLGFLRADATRTRYLRRVHEVTTNGTSAPLQWAAGRSGVLGSASTVAAVQLAKRRDLVHEVLEELGLRAYRADGGCFLFADIAGATREDSADFVRRILAERNVLVVPGTAFTTSPLGRSYVRVAFNRSVETIETARRRLLA
jgi:aminotransferase